MRQYQELLQDILVNGVWKEPAREGMPRTKEVFCRMMRFDLSEGFPLLTTKRMFTKGIVAELLWFLHGDTNIKFLLENDVHIWDADAYKHYKRHGGKEPISSWLHKVMEGGIDPSTHEPYGECGKIYGYQWRQKDGFDQIANLIYTLRNYPTSRYQIVTAWSPKHFLGDRFGVALPACHVMFQCCINEGRLDLMMLQRSCDTFLGVPFNIASYALLTHILAKAVDVEPGEFIWVGNCCHIYENHLEQVEELLTREPMSLCTVSFDWKPLEQYTVEDFHFISYHSYPALKAPLSVGF